MIRAIFQQDEGGFSGVDISGHAGFADSGADIVCAAVASAVQMAANGITEVLGAVAAVTVEENRVALALPGDAKQGARAFLAALHLHLTALREEYGDYIEIILSEK